MFRPGFVHLDSIVDIHFAVPEVVNCDPEPGAVAVEAEALLIFEVYYATGGATPVLGSIEALVNGVSAVSGGVIQAGFAGPRSGILVHTPNRIQFTLDPVEWEGLSTYEVEVAFLGSDAAPGSLSWTFTTEDTHGPVVEAVVPTSRRVLRVDFVQGVVSSPSSVSVAFPWGNEPLTLSGASWGFSPVSYPWVKADRLGGYNLTAGSRLQVKVDGVYHSLSIPWDTTDELTTAAALDAILGPVGGGCHARNGYAWLYSQNPEGSLEVLAGGANVLLACEVGEKTRRLAFGTPEGTYALTVTSIQPSGLVSVATITRSFTHADGAFTLLQSGEEVSTSMLEASAYTITVDEVDCQRRRAPAFTPGVASVTLLGTDSVLVTLEQDMTPGAHYTLHVTGVRDTAGNLIEPNPTLVEFEGYSPSVPAKRQFRLYDFFGGFLKQQDQAHGYTFETVCAILQEVLDQLFADLDEYGTARNPANAPENVVDDFLAMYGNPFDFLGLPLGTRRILLEYLVDLHKLRGTEPGVDAALRFFFGFTTIDFIYYWGTGWLLGVPGRTDLGSTTVLNSSILARRFSFSIAVDRVLTDVERVQVRQVVERMKTGHTHFIAIEEPVSPFVPDHWQIPWSELGVNTRLH